jgi:DsbC/DsbD-like thiol-disulfide interchange protein
VTRAARWCTVPSAVLMIAGPRVASGQPALTARSAHVHATVVDRGIARVAGGRTVRDRRVLVLTVADGWHIYGTQSGTSGIPTRLQWTVASPARVSEVQWPTTNTVIRGRDTTFEYEGEVTVPFTIESVGAPNAGRHAVDISLGVCRNVCVPERLRVVFRTR